MFVDDLAVEHIGGGRYVGTLGRELSLFDHAQGGVAMAIALRAVETTSATTAA